MSKTKKIISLSVEPEMHDLLKISAKKMRWSVSKLCRHLVEKHLDLVVNDGDKVPVIFKIPESLRSDEVALRQWLEAKVNATVNALVKKDSD